MKANGYYNHPRVPLEAGCGLIEEDSIAFTSVSGKTAETPSFPLEIFPKAIRDIIEALEEYENYNVDFTAASFLTVFAAAMGQHMVSPLHDRVGKPTDNLHGACRLAELRQDSAFATGGRTSSQTRRRV